MVTSKLDTPTVLAACVTFFGVALVGVRVDLEGGGLRFGVVRRLEGGFGGGGASFISSTSSSAGSSSP